MTHSKYDNSRTVLHKDYQIVGTEEPMVQGQNQGLEAAKLWTPSCLKRLGEGVGTETQRERNLMLLFERSNDP